MSLAEFARRMNAAERALHALGITFTVYSDSDAIDRILPFDVIPRVISAEEWRHIERGVDPARHRAQPAARRPLSPADDPAGRRHCRPIWSSATRNYRPLMRGVELPHKAYVNICGTDIVRGDDGRVPRARGQCPHPVRGQLRDREPAHDAARLSRPAGRDRAARRWTDYGLKLVAALREMAPAGTAEPRVVLLSPGTYNSAYFEHVFLAREMGVPLVEGRDLVVEDDRVYMRTIGGLARVDVIYRRINDDFLDPEAFRPDSMLGVPGLMRAYRAGNVALANAVGTGVADDKAVYAYMPRIIRYYLERGPDPAECRDPYLPRAGGAALHARPSRPSWSSSRSARPAATASRSGRRPAAPNSRNAAPNCSPIRPTTSASPASICRSRRPCSMAGSQPRHVDLRPFAITGNETWVLPGGLTRVALREGSLVVNSSQGGGSKDTWVLE